MFYSYLTPAFCQRDPGPCTRSRCTALRARTPRASCARLATATPSTSRTPSSASPRRASPPGAASYAGSAALAPGRARARRSELETPQPSRHARSWLRARGTTDGAPCTASSCMRRSWGARGRALTRARAGRRRAAAAVPVRGGRGAALARRRRRAAGHPRECSAGAAALQARARRREHPNPTLAYDRAAARRRPRRAAAACGAGWRCEPCACRRGRRARPCGRRCGCAALWRACACLLH